MNPLLYEDLVNCVCKERRGLIRGIYTPEVPISMNNCETSCSVLK